MGGDDGLDVLEVDDDGPLPAEHGGGAGELGVEDAEIAAGEPRPAHDVVLPGLHHPGHPRRVHRKPCPRPRPLLPRPRPAAPKTPGNDRRLRLVVRRRHGLPRWTGGFSAAASHPPRDLLVAAPCSGAERQHHRILVSFCVRIPSNCWSKMPSVANRGSST